MKKIVMTTSALLILLLLVGCGANTTDFSEGGAEGKVTQLVKENIGNQYGPESVKTVKVHITLVKEGATKGRMFVNGNADYKREFMQIGKKQTRSINVSFQFELQHNGIDWTVKNKLFFDEKQK